MRVDKKKLKIAMIMKEISINELSQMSMLSRSTIWRMMEHEANPSTVKAVSTALNVPMESLLVNN